jgi:hypothetical protein
VRRTLAFVLLACAAFAQDERRVTSPNGQIAFRLFIATQNNSNLSRVAYEVFFEGKALLKTSFLGLDIENQEPLLGENVGLTSSASTKAAKYNSLTAKYMQNGSLGRLINLEVRAYNDGVAFRYAIPPSTPLTELTIQEEATEFRFTQNIPEQLDRPILIGATWVMIAESKPGSYPAMRLTRLDQTTGLTRLARSFAGTTPLTCPWRIVVIGPAAHSSILTDLNVFMVN